jgi:hypothetical protein
MRELTDLMHDLLSPAISHRAEFVPPLSPLLASALPTFFLPPVRGRRQEEGGESVMRGRLGQDLTRVSRYVRQAEPGGSGSG